MREVTDVTQLAARPMKRAVKVLMPSPIASTTPVNPTIIRQPIWPYPLEDAGQNRPGYSSWHHACSNPRSY